MSKHTPGPWVSKNVGTAMPGGWYVGCDDYPVCEILDEYPEAEANAHLIAAAPNMLGALEEAYKEVLSYREEIYDAATTGEGEYIVPSDEEDVRELDGKLDRWKIVIAGARGEQR